MDSKVVERNGIGNFAYESDFEPIMGDRYTVLAYGIRVNSERAALKLGQLAAPTAESIAKIDASRSLNDTDITLTQTSGSSFVASAGPVNP